MNTKTLLCLSKDQSTPYVLSGSYDFDMHSIGGNSGNNVFQYSIQNILSSEAVEIKARRELKNEYDWSNYNGLMILPANLLAANSGNRLNYWTDTIRNVKLPTYVVAIGAQSQYDYSFEFLKQIRKEAYNFIKIVLDSGGKIGCRGYFTQEVICKLGFKPEDCEVIGCPSIFINGKDLQIYPTKLDENELIPMLNGNPLWNHPQVGQYFTKYQNSYFVDQDKFYRLLYYPQNLARKDLKFLAGANNMWYKMYEQNRIKFYGDYDAWVNELKNLKINFSFGSRIHGNILPILQGIPSYILATDSRVRELAEYFEIPFEKMPKKLKSLYEYYQMADYTNFNKNFAVKYQKFANFIGKCGLKVSPAQNQIDTTRTMLEISLQNREKIRYYNKWCGHSKVLYLLYITYRALVKKIKKR